MNMVQHMKANNHSVATHRIANERWHIMYGLPGAVRCERLLHGWVVGGYLHK
jgi:hypothetical protein